MKRYKAKVAYLRELQSGLCAITGKPLERPQLHHVIAKSKVNRRAYPHLIDSVWNLRLVNPDAHLTAPLPVHIPYYIARRVEEHLEEHSYLAALINMELAAWHKVREVANLFDLLLIEVWPERSTG